MKRMNANFTKMTSFITAILMLFCLPMEAKAHTKEEVRARWEQAETLYEGEYFAKEPSAGAPYARGELLEGPLASVLGRINFMRYLAGIPEVELSEELCAISQTGAVLQAAQGFLSHSPEQPEDMEAGFYQTAYLSASESNLTVLNWSGRGVLESAIELFMRDDTGSNLLAVGHRRWVLSPCMQYTGVGLAHDAPGRSYVTMHVLDMSGEAEYRAICWPAEGAFPAEFLTRETPWSISLNPDIYDLSVAPRIELTEEKSGAQFAFESLQEDVSQVSYYILNTGGYGDGPVLIFRPDVQNIGGYSQNQVWKVRLSGLVCADGTPAEDMLYCVEMMSLLPIDPADVELSGDSADMQVGETRQFSACVVPDWADDLSVRYESSDETVLRVEENGLVTAVGPGSAEITALAVNGRSDSIQIVVGEE